MNINDLLVKELFQEAAATRRVLERVPEDKLSWTPHPKSMTLGQLALHVAIIPGGLAELLSELIRETPKFTQAEAASLTEILSAHERSLDIAAAKLSSWTEDDLMAEWRLNSGTQTLVAQPRITMVRSLMFNHWYHHRGQLVVYLRMLGVPLPAVYGPSADESPF